MLSVCVWYFSCQVRELELVCSTLIVWWHSPPRPPSRPHPKTDDVFQRRSGQDKSKIVNVRRGSPLIIQRWRQFWWIHSWNAAHRIGLFPIPTRPHSVQSLDTISSLDLINLYCTWQLCYLPDCLPILFPKYPWQVFPICHPISRWLNSTKQRGIIGNFLRQVFHRLRFLRTTHAQHALVIVLLFPTIFNWFTHHVYRVIHLFIFTLYGKMHWFQSIQHISVPLFKQTMPFFNFVSRIRRRTPFIFVKLRRKLWFSSNHFSTIFWWRLICTSWIHECLSYPISLQTITYCLCIRFP